MSVCVCILTYNAQHTGWAESGHGKAEADSYFSTLQWTDIIQIYILYMRCVYLCSSELCTVYTGECVTEIVSFIYDHHL